MAAEVDDTDRLERLFEAQVTLGLHHGAQLAVYKDGEQVIDLAAGTTGPEGEPVTSDQRFLIFSTTKPLAAVPLHQLVEAGELAYDDPVVEYWPAFARGDDGKDAVTVRHVLSHQAGLPSSEFDTQPDEWPDWEAAVTAMERAELSFEPGTDAAYHALSYGWLVGELVRRITGETVGSRLREHVFDPLGISDTHLGLPADLPDDVATLVGFDDFDRCRDPSGGLDANRGAAAANFNREDFHRAEMPAANAVGTASDLARLYACLANGGSLDGATILSPATVDEATSLQRAVEADAITGAPMRYGLGFLLAGTPFDSYGTLAPPSSFGHAGLGSSVAWADPADDLAVAVITNGIRDGAENRLRLNELGDAARRVFGGSA